VGVPGREGGRRGGATGTAGPVVCINAVAAGWADLGLVREPFFAPFLSPFFILVLLVGEATGGRKRERRGRRRRRRQGGRRRRNRRRRRASPFVRVKRTPGTCAGSSALALPGGGRD